MKAELERLAGRLDKVLGCHADSMPKESYFEVDAVMRAVVALAARCDMHTNHEKSNTSTAECSKNAEMLTAGEPLPEPAYVRTYYDWPDQHYYTADQIRKYAETVAAHWREMAIRLSGAEQDAMLARRTAERERDEARQLVRDLFAQYTKFYGVPVDAPPFIYHAPAWKALHERAQNVGAIDSAMGGRQCRLSD